MNVPRRIPVCAPYLAGREEEYVLDALRTNWISSKGKYIEGFERAFGEYVGARHAIATNNGTTACHLALAAAGVGEGDEVVMPAFTMIATAFAVVYLGAKPVLVDADPETWTMATDATEKAVTERTRTIFPVHIYGHPVDLDPILRLGRSRGLKVVEDAAEAHGAEYRGRRVGALGDVGAFSFYANKNLTTGEGGMVVTNDDETAKRARLLKDLAFTEHGRYLHDEVGWNYRMTNLQAAIGLAQTERADEILAMKRAWAKRYHDLLAQIPGIATPPEKSWAKNCYWMYGILIRDEFGHSRDAVMDGLTKRGIETRRFFTSMHRQPALTKRGWFSGERYPVTDDLSRRGLYLPSSVNLTPEDQDAVVAALRDIRERGP